MKGAADAAFSTVLEVGGDKIRFNLEPPISILVTLFAYMGSHKILYFGILGCSAVGYCWNSQRDPPTPLVYTCGWAGVFFNLSDCWTSGYLSIYLAWVLLLTPLYDQSTSVPAYLGDDGCLPHVYGVRPWGDVCLCYWGRR